MEAIIVALVGVVGSILVVLIEKGRKENTRDHAAVANQLETITDVLKDIDEDVAHIESKIDNHLEDHIQASLGKNNFNQKKKTNYRGSKKR